MDTPYERARQRWLDDGQRYGWLPPNPASSWLRWPVIRWFRYVRSMWAVERHYAFGIGSIGLRSGYDNWVLFGMFHGWI